MRIYYLFFMATLLVPFSGYSEVVPFNDKNWTFSGEITKKVTYAGQDALYISEGSAVLKNAIFEDGIIEVDLIFPDDQRGFSGITWRMQEDDSYEHFYIRPHLSKQSDASQYTPVFHGDTGWQLYFGPQYSVALEFKYNTWMHLKIVVAGDQAEIYLDSEKPVLYINDLKADLPAGGIGISSTFAPAYFANFSYEKIDNPPLMGSPEPTPKLPENLITNINVSDVVPDNIKSPSEYNGQWTRINMETNGAFNISRFRQRSASHNTVLVKMTISSEYDTTRKFSYGYSDNAVAYINNTPLAGGTNTYQSRDYRYLGTIGLFDDIYLPLKKGKNEIYFAISEEFGGWGFMGKFENMDGLTLE